MENFMKSVIFKVLIAYWVIIICLTYIGRWLSANSHFLSLGFVFLLTSVLALGGGVFAYRMYRRW